jgi:hypothetical protein
MKKRFWLLGTLAVFLLAVAPVGAQTIDDRIKSLEQELIQLKEQQIEMKKEATAAVEAMPSFTYRPGNGLLIEAADKSWSWRAALETHFRYYFDAGRDQVGRSNGEMEGRRFRPGWFFCVNNCLWEIEATLDLDGFGGNTALQRGAVNFHGENINPWLPTVQFGMEVQNAAGGSLARQGSGNTGAQAEYDLHTQNNGFNTGRAGSGGTLNWDDRSLSSIGIPGRIGRFQLGMSAIAEGDDGTQVNTDRKDFNIYLSLQPFSEVKNKWLSGLTWEYGSWFCNVDNRALQNGCSRYRVQDNSRAGRQTLYDTGANSIGDGLHVAHGPGVVYNVGPYTLRAMGSFQMSEDRGGGIGTTSGQPNIVRGKKRANSFLIAHDIYLWSPKGFLTGSATTPNSILWGQHFERVNMSLGCNGSTGIPCTAAGLTGNPAANIGHLGQFHRTRILLREWDLWYVLAPRMNIGINVLWYDASNLRNGRNQAAHNLGICDTPVSASSCRPGIGGDWVDVFLNWRYSF